MQSSYISKLNCVSSSDLTLIDNATEVFVLKENLLNDSKYDALDKFNNMFDLFVTPIFTLEQCEFNSTFNPASFHKQMLNLEDIKTLLFVNPFFITTLLIVNFLRILMLRYLNNMKAVSNKSVPRKKEIYYVFGRYFIGSFLMITCQISIILYFILWGYLLLNENRLLIDKWTSFSCLDQRIRGELTRMGGQINKIETYNMVIIGSMIISCILEALFSQYRLVKAEVYEQLRETS